MASGAETGEAAGNALFSHVFGQFLILSLGKSKQQKVADLAKGAGNKVISRNRLVRHRDGKNLGLGLGLTTGLGWSDRFVGCPSTTNVHPNEVVTARMKMHLLPSGGISLELS